MKKIIVYISLFLILSAQVFPAHAFTHAHKHALSESPITADHGHNDHVNVCDTCVGCLHHMASLWIPEMGFPVVEKTGAKILPPCFHPMSSRYDFRIERPPRA